MPEVNFGHIIVRSQCTDWVIKCLEFERSRSYVIVDRMPMRSGAIMNKPNFGGIWLGNRFQGAYHCRCSRGYNVVALPNFIANCLLHCGPHSGVCH